jgi:UDP-N-acetylglucosamine--N-acetylmuramyl-(pentapeptide) pyrophosphoryl-undecaprenol N-acetylglucosamine transferase
LSPAYQDKVWVSGYPVRLSLFTVDRSSSYEQLDLDPDLQTVLVLGGSRGARAINQSLFEILGDLLSRYQVIHVSGQLDWPWVQEQRTGLPEALQERYHAYPYLHQELSAAMTVADLVVARAGAATMAEFPAVGLPSILIPYPYAGGHQALNADFVERHGAGIRLDEAQLKDQLGALIDRLLNDRELLAHMAERARALSQPDAAARLARQVIQLARVREEGVQ